MKEQNWIPKQYKNYKWIVKDPEFIGGKLAVKGTRFSVSFILACLSDGMTSEDIDNDYSPFPHEAIPEIFKVASEVLETPNVAA